MSMFKHERLRTLAHWMVEREIIRVARAMHTPPPWTKDPLIANTRWTNVRRMDDKVSIWLLENWYRGRTGTHGEAVTAAAVARLVNWPATLQRLKEQMPKWNQRTFQSVLHYRADSGQKVFTGVYIINSASGGKGSSKIDVVANTINTVHSVGRGLVDTGSMQNTHTLLCTVPGIGSFIAGQMVADLRWVLRGTWADRHTWAPYGPGSLRGISWLRDAVVTQKEFCTVLKHLREEMVYRFTPVASISADRNMELMDWQNCMCEISKYARLQTGGRAKNRYVPGTGS